MKIENILQPNCSELAMYLPYDTIEEAIKELQNLGVKIIVVMNNISYKNLSYKLIGLLVKKFKSFSAKITSLELLTELHKLSLKEKQKFMKFIKLQEVYKDMEIIAIYKNGKARLQIGDYTRTKEEDNTYPVLEIHDYDIKAFPLFRLLETKGGEIKIVDGGRMYEYNKWVKKLIKRGENNGI